MANLTNMPTEVLLEIEKHLPHPFSEDAIALSSTCKSTWERTGAARLYIRAAIQDRDRIRDAEADEIARTAAALADTEEGEIIEAGHAAFEERTTITTNSAGIVIVRLPEYKRNPIYPDGWPTFDQATGSCLNQAIRQCRDMAKLELVIDVYHQFVPSVFRGSWHRLEELTPIQTAIRAKRLDVVQLLFNKGLAPECNETILGRPLLSWGNSEELPFWGNPDEDMKPVVRCRPNLFNMALAARSEGICLFLLKNSYELRFDSRPYQADTLLLHLSFAEEYNMYRLIDALLDDAKERLQPRVYQLLLRQMLLKTPKDGFRFDPLRLLPPGTLHPNPMIDEPNRDWSLPNKAHILSSLLRRGAADGRLRFTNDEEPWMPVNYPLKRIVKKGHLWSANLILRHQIATGTVDAADLIWALPEYKCLRYRQLDFFQAVWPKRQHLLYRQELSAEENAQAIKRCWSICLGNAMLGKARPGKPDSVYAQLKLAVEPGLFHLCCAIKSDRPDIVDELVLVYGLDPHRELASDYDVADLVYEDKFMGSTDFSYANTAFAVAVDDWGLINPRPALCDMAMICRLVYRCGAPKSWSDETRDKLHMIWEHYHMGDYCVYDRDEGQWRPYVDVREIDRDVLLFDRREDEEKIQMALLVLYQELWDAVDKSEREGFMMGIETMISELFMDD
ncbi:hypothetical protein PG996_014112 [Apiospora saccharicola]|uniref:F-box domain-containing protein n=1 Tax=Apiospora saccharicola TaxID=335842 RepID=A0ABR1THD2_9PEZI